MNAKLMTFLTLTNIGEQWLRQDTYQCLQSITEKYLLQSSRIMFLNVADPPSWLWAVPAVSYDDSSVVDIRYADALFITPKIERNQIASVQGRVVVVVNNTEGIKVLWEKFRMIDVIVLAQKPTSSEVYTWFPYRKATCWEYPKLEVIDTCVKGTLVQKRNLYPVKIPKTFGNCPIIVSTIERPFYSYDITESEYKGAEGLLVTAMTENLQLSDRIFRMTLADELPNKTVKNSLPLISRVLMNRDVDLVGGALVARVDRHLIADLTAPYYFDNLVFAKPPLKRRPLVDGLHSGFSGLIWCLIALALLLFLFVVHLSSRRDRPIDLSSSMLIALGVILSMPTSSNLHFNSILVCIWILFLVFSIHLSCFYQSTLLFNLFKIPYEKPFETMDEALDAGMIVATTFGQFDLLATSTNNIWKRIVSSKQFEVGPGVASIAGYKTGARIITANAEDLKIRLRNQTNGGQVDFFEDHLYPIWTVLYMPKNHPLYEIISMKVHQVCESGLMGLWASWELEGGFIPKSDKKTEPLTLEHLQSLFIVCGLFIMGRILVFIVELTSGSK